MMRTVRANALPPSSYLPLDLLLSLGIDLLVAHIVGAAGVAGRAFHAERISQQARLSELMDKRVHFRPSRWTDTGGGTARSPFLFAAAPCAIVIALKPPRPSNESELSSWR